jgi:hypothetical protein
MRAFALVMALMACVPCPALGQAAKPVSNLDGESIENVTSALYQVISGPAGGRDWTRFRSLFADGARLIPIRVTATGSSPLVLTVEGYVARAGASFEKAAFYESEISRRVETFGNIAHVFSTYESRHAPGEKPFARGINSIQMVNDGKAWKVITILWDAERPGLSLPEKYLK